MTIPARNVRCAFAQHRLRFHHEIFQNFVESGAHMHVSIGEWRPVMQHKQLAAFSRFLDLLVDSRLLPCSQHLRLARREVRLHRKFRVWQINSIFVVLTHDRAREAT